MLAQLLFGLLCGCMLGPVSGVQTWLIAEIHANSSCNSAIAAALIDFGCQQDLQVTGRWIYPQDGFGGAEEVRIFRECPDAQCRAPTFDENGDPVYAPFSCHGPWFYVYGACSFDDGRWTVFRRTYTRALPEPSAVGVYQAGDSCFIPRFWASFPVNFFWEKGTSFYT